VQLRKNGRGLVIIQTSDHEHEVIKMVVKNDYNSFYNYQAEERRNFSYPPFCRLVQISLRHTEKAILDDAAGKLAKALKEIPGCIIAGPEYPLIGKTHKLYIKNILIKITNRTKLAEIKLRIQNYTDSMISSVMCRNVRANIDVDPY